MGEKQSENRIQTVCLLVLSTVAIAAALLWLRPVMIPFVLAIFFSLILSPLINFQMRRLRFPRPLAVLTTFLLGFAVLFLIGLIMTSSINQLIKNADQYQTQLNQLIDRATGALPLEWFEETAAQSTENGSEADRKFDAKQLISPKALGSAFIKAANSAMSMLSQGTMVMIFLLFLLIGQQKSKHQPQLWLEVAPRVQRYIVIKSLLSVLTGVLVGITLWVLGIHLALAFGFLVVIFNFIPSIGSILATLLPLPVVVLSPEISPLAAVLAIAIPAVIQFAIGNVIEPKIMGDMLELHPVTIMIALIIWGMLWGIVGMLLATPITAIMKILFTKLDQTKPVARIMAGQFGPPD
ncbi:MAG: AI-2E family transporter [Myxococcota bacterium]|nr:AI-2E family transporter [Myxococcota bacterium]